MVLNGKCSKCISKYFAESRGVNIFCTPFSQDGMEHIVITDIDASTCKYFQEMPEDFGTVLELTAIQKGVE